MRLTSFRKHLANALRRAAGFIPAVFLLCGWFVSAAPALFAQSAQAAEQPAAAPPLARSPRDFLHSPREAVKTLYFAVIAYDLRPQLINEAIACLDLDPAQTADPAEAVRLAIDLEQTLRILCVPLHSVPEKTERDTVVVLDSEGFKISLARGTDGLWRFSRDTVDRIPTMNRVSLARFRSLQADRAQLLDEYTDPSATLRRFLMDTIARDFYAAARCLDLSTLPPEERTEKGPLLARQLAFVMQRRGWVFLQEVPNQPDGPPYTWHADKSGRIALERGRLPDGKQAWLFNKKTVRNIPAMYEQAKDRPADPRYTVIGAVLPPLASGDDPSLSKQRPADVPAHLGSPRALLKGFFRVMDAAEAKDSKLIEALEYLDLQAIIPQADRQVQGVKVAIKLEAVLRKIHVELSALPDDWNAPTQVLGEPEGVHLEIVRQRDGRWRFSQNTVGQAAAFFDKLAAKDKSEHDRSAHLDSARDTMSTFLTGVRGGEYDQAADCLDLASFRPGTQDEVGPVLACKLYFVLGRLGRVYIQEVPDEPDGPRYIFYRGELGRIVIARKAEGPRKGSWLFTPETVARIEHMFRTVVAQPVLEPNAENDPQTASFWQSPGIWVHSHMPRPLAVRCWGLQIFQWLGLVLAVGVSYLAARLLLAQLHRLLALFLHHSGSVLTKSFVAAKLRPLTWMTAWLLLFWQLALLDLPARFLDAILPLKVLGMAGLIGWLGVQIVDLVIGVSMNSELLRPHRNLSDMVVPVLMRLLKGVILLLVAVYVVYEFGEGESLGRFLTGLGVAGLAVSLAAQDALKSFFSTLLLIGERSFKIGDRITVGGQEGVVEQVGFRATRLRTADGSQLTVPNSTITSGPVGNLSPRAFSHYQASLLINADGGPERLRSLRDRMRAWLLQHPHVRHDKVEVGVNGLTGRGVEVTLDLYLSGTAGAAEKGLREEINREVLRLCAGSAEEVGEKTAEVTAAKHQAA